MVICGRHFMMNIRHHLITLHKYLKYCREMLGILPSGMDHRGKHTMSAFGVSRSIRFKDTYTKEKVLKFMQLHHRH